MQRHRLIGQLQPVQCQQAASWGGHLQGQGQTETVFRQRQHPVQLMILRPLWQVLRQRRSWALLRQPRHLAGQAAARVAYPQQDERPRE